MLENLVSVGKGVTRESKKILVEGIGEVHDNLRSMPGSFNKIKNE